MTCRLLSVVAAAGVAASLALAQSAGARAVVSSEKLPVYLKMSPESTQVFQLSKGDVVVIGLVMFGDDITWCAISKLGESKRLGYVACEQLQPDKAQSHVETPPVPAPAAAPATAAPPPAAREPKAPIRAREVAPPPIRVREVEPARIEKPESNAPAIPAPSRPAVERPLPDGRDTESRGTVRVREVEPAKIRIREIEPAKIQVREVSPGQLPATVTAPAPGLAPANAPLPPSLDRPQDFLTLSLVRTGILAEMDRFMETTHPISFLDKTRLARADAGKVRTITGRHWQPSVIRDHIAQRVAASYDPQRMTELMKWVQSPLALKTELAVTAGSGPERRRQLSEFAQGLRANPPSRERLEWIHRVQAAQQVTPAEVAFTMTVVRETALGLNPALPAEMRVAPKDLDPALLQVKQTYEPVMLNAAIVYLLFLFRDFPDEQLRQLAEFWESDLGKWISAAVTQGLDSAGAAVSKRIGAELGAAR